MRMIDGLGQHLADLLDDMPDGFELHVRPSRVEAEASRGFVEVKVVRDTYEPSPRHWSAVRLMRHGRQFPLAVDASLTRMVAGIRVATNQPRKVPP